MKQKNHQQNIIGSFIAGIIITLIVLVIKTVFLKLMSLLSRYFWK
jgi:capsular polysaccharide biosynthesis protein